LSPLKSNGGGCCLKIDSHLELDSSYGLWTAALGKILTMDDLKKRAIIIVHWCCMSKSDGELVAHLLLYCPDDRELWDLLLCLLEVTWVMPHSVLAMLESWRGTMGRVRGVWGLISCLMWGLLEREELAYLRGHGVIFATS
jgi:hypothetical protein